MTALLLREGRIMSRNFIKKPDKYFFYKDFSTLSASETEAIKAELMLEMTTHELSTLQKSLSTLKNDASVDELYLYDEVAAIKKARLSDKKIDILRSDSELIREAFSDLADKRRALGDRSHVSLSSLVGIYSKYLVETGYDDSARTPFEIVPKVNTLPSADTMVCHTGSVFFTAESESYAYSLSDRNTCFNTDKKRVTFTEPGLGMTSLLLVRVPEFPLAYETLSDRLDSTPQLASNIIWTSPVGEDGIINKLEGLGTGMTLSFSDINMLFPELERPYMLARPLSAVIILCHPLASESLISGITDLGFEVRQIGSFNFSESSVYIDFKGSYISYYPNVLKALKDEEVNEVKVYEYDGEIKKYVSDELTILSITDSRFEKIYTAIREEATRLETDERRVFGGFILPENNKAYSRFFALYRAFAESAIPIRKSVFINSDFDTFSVILCPQKR